MSMKKYLAALAIAIISLSAAAQTTDDYTYTEAAELTVLGKVFPDTPDPYKRMDYAKHGGWTKNDRRLLDMSSGIIISFKTDSPAIVVKAELEKADRTGNSGWATRGFDLYIKKDGKWMWAGVKHAPDDIEKSPVLKLVENMSEGSKECLLYLPLFSVLKSVKIGVEPGRTLVPGDRPFRHDIVIHGSSFMHGASTSRAGATVPAMLTRNTGLQFNSLGVSGDCKMQPQFAEALKDAKADAFVFDAFSNPSAEVIEERLFPFIDTVRSTHPGVPIIFISSIYRGNRNFDVKLDEKETAKEKMAEKLMKEACRKYKDVYFIKSDASCPDHETTTDGTHPGDFGYYLWTRSIEKPLLKILKKYGIR